ncbi:TPA: S1C family serine protease [Streptococcus suis]
MKEKTPFWKGLFGGIVGTVLTLAMVFFLSVSGITQNGVTKVSSQTDGNVTQTATDFEATIMNAIDVVGDAVVTVNNLQAPGQMMYQTQLEEYFYNNQQGGIDLEDPEANLTVVGSGSGVVYKIDGNTAYIVTNNHVVEGASKLEVVTTTGDTVDATLVGTDVFSDLAVITIDASNVSSTITFTDSDQVKVGSLAIAIGSPLDNAFSSSVTQGIISGVNRVLPVDLTGDQVADWEQTLIQTDAAINPGNSGGALVNKDGQLIGINSSKMSATGVEGMGFAIPANEVAFITSQLEANGQVNRPMIGINANVVPVESLTTRAKVEVLNLAEDASEGIVVREVVPGGSAEAAGLQQYDVITKINDQAINSLMELRQAIYQHQVGDSVQVTILRQGQEQVLTITLEAGE